MKISLNSFLTIIMIIYIIYVPIHKQLKTP